MGTDLEDNAFWQPINLAVQQAAGKDTRCVPQVLVYLPCMEGSAETGPYRPFWEEAWERGWNKDPRSYDSSR